jgi:hypothetical protein
MASTAAKAEDADEAARRVFSPRAESKILLKLDLLLVSMCCIM